MNILIVGAGAVGKVYGRHLSLSGEKVSFFVKDKYLESSQLGFDFYELNHTSSSKAPLHWRPQAVLSTLSEVDAQTWDYVILSMSSPALKSGWFQEFAHHLKKACIVSFQPGFYDREYLLKFIPEKRLLMGTIPIVSYEAPLPKETRPKPGTAYWIPQGSSIAMSGTHDLADPLTLSFTRGGIKAKVVPDALKENQVAGPALTLFITALRQSDWSFENLIHSPRLNLACNAMPEAIHILAKKMGTLPSKGRLLLKPIFFRSLIRLSPILVPFDFETYLKVHFTKVDEQMRALVDDFISYGDAHSLPTKQLKALREGH